MCDNTAHHITAHHSTAQHSTAQHSTAQHSTAQHSIAVLPIRNCQMGHALCRCPVLALSATIDSPEQVTEWLQSVKAPQQQQDTKLGIASPSQRYKVNLIQRAKCCADLRYHSLSQLQPSRMVTAPTQPQLLRQLSRMVKMCSTRYIHAHC